jgi:hypothetical protein
LRNAHGNNWRHRTGTIVSSFAFPPINLNQLLHLMPVQLFYDQNFARKEKRKRPGQRRKGWTEQCEI